jgi:hypothetical protein
MLAEASSETECSAAAVGDCTNSVASAVASELAQGAEATTVAFLRGGM